MEYTPAKTIVQRVKHGDQWFGGDYRMNIYRGCNQGCVYCDSRSDCYQMTDFDTVRAKENALEIIRRELRSKRSSGVITTGAASDPYNSFERETELSRRALELINANGFGIGIATKSTLVTRDIDVLREIKKRAPTLVKMTITCGDDAMAAQLEPGAPSSSERFAALEKLATAGIFSGILMMPIMPFLSDTEQSVTTVVRRAAEVGARFIYPWFGLSMRSGQREYMYARFDERFPGLSETYRRTYGDRYECLSPNHKQLQRLFRNECNRAGILYRMNDIIAAYKSGYETQQLSLF